MAGASGGGEFRGYDRNVTGNGQAEPRATLGQRRAKRSQRSALRNWAEYLSVRLFSAALNLVPIGLAYRLSEGLLLAGYALLPRPRARARATLEVAFAAERDREWLESTFWESVRYQAWFFVDVMMGPRLLRKPEWLSRVDLSELDGALRREEVGVRRGALLVGSHQGAPHVASLAAAISGWPHAAVSRPFGNTMMWRMLQELQAGFDRPDLARHGALRPALRLLRRNGVVAIQIDQDAGRHGVFVPFFGKPASTHTGAATLALLSGVPIYMIAGIRTERRAFRFKVYCWPLAVKLTGDHDEDVLALTAAMTAQIEVMIRRFPEQHFWVHRRWKTQPPKAVM